MKLKSRFPEKMEYIARTEWDGKTGGIATLRETELVFDTPTTYGGRGQGLCPYRLYISGVLGCLNNTFLDIKRRSGLELISFNLEGKLTVQFDGEGYKIKKFYISGQLEVNFGDLEFGERCVELAQKFCPLTRTMKECINFEYDIKVTEI